MMIISNQVLANTPMHKEALGQDRYTAPRMFGYGAQMRKFEQHENQFKQQMDPFHAAATGKTQNRHPSNVTDRSHGSPLDKEEASSRCVVLVKKQQPDSTTKPDVQPKEIAAAILASTTAGIEHAMQELPVPRTLQTFFWWVGVMMRHEPESTQIKALNAAKLTICDMLSEVMVKMTVPPGMEAGFAQPVMTALIQLLEDRDMRVVHL